MSMVWHFKAEAIYRLVFQTRNQIDLYSFLEQHVKKFVKLNYAKLCKNKVTNNKYYIQLNDSQYS